MAFATLPAAAILAGLVAGTGVVATYVSTATEAQPIQTVVASTEKPETAKVEAVKIETPKSCDTQTWPYIEQRCLAGKTGTDKPVRFVSASTGETIPQANTTPVAKSVPAPDAGQLVSRDTVLRAPNYYNSVPAVPGNLASEQRQTRKQMRREARKQRNDQRWSAQSYQVPAAARYGDRAVIVVRPLREAFR